MGKEVRGMQDAMYRLPEDAQLRLQQIHDRLELLAAMTMPRKPGDDAADGLCIRPSALAHCFRELAEDVAGVLHAARWCG